MPTNGTRLILFDIDGTLLSAGRAARDSILAALDSVLMEGLRRWDDFSGRRTAQILRELVQETVGPYRFDATLAEVLDRTSGTVETPAARSRRPQARHSGAPRAARPGAAGGSRPPDREHRTRRPAEAPAARVQPLLPLRSVRRRLRRPLLPSFRGSRPGPGAHRPRLSAGVRGRHRRLGARRRVRPGSRRPHDRGRDGPHAAEKLDAARRTPSLRLLGFGRNRRILDEGRAGLLVLAASRALLRRSAPAPTGPAAGAPRAPYEASPAGRHSIEIQVDSRAAVEILAFLSRPAFDAERAHAIGELPAVRLTIQDSRRTLETFERDLAAAFDEETKSVVFDLHSIRVARPRGEAVLSAVPLARVRHRAKWRPSARRRSPASRGLRAPAGLPDVRPGGLADHSWSWRPTGPRR